MSRLFPCKFTFEPLPDSSQHDDFEEILPFLPRVGDTIMYRNHHYLVAHVVYGVTAEYFSVPYTIGLRDPFNTRANKHFKVEYTY